MGMEIFNASTSQRRWPRFAAVAVVLTAATLAGVMFATHQPNRPTALQGPVVLPASSPSLPAADPSPSELPVDETPSPAPPVVAPPPSPSPVVQPVQYTCSSKTITAPAIEQTLIQDARHGIHDGYDRFTVEFRGAQPESVKLIRQDSATFTASPTGESVVLAGQYGLQVVITSTDAHTAYNGAKVWKLGYPAIREIRQLEDFEGYVQYGLGLSKPACYRAYFMTNPTRLVVDIQTE